LAGAFRPLARSGFDEGVAGHIAARDPEHPEWFWANPFGMHLSRICASDLTPVNERGEVIQGDYPSISRPWPNTLLTRGQVAGGIDGCFPYRPVWTPISRREPGRFD
jgi:hypothetical protein